MYTIHNEFKPVYIYRCIHIWCVLYNYSIIKCIRWSCIRILTTAYDVHYVIFT